MRPGSMIPGVNRALNGNSGKRNLQGESANNAKNCNDVFQAVRQEVPIMHLRTEMSRPHVDKGPFDVETRDSEESIIGSRNYSGRYIRKQKMAGAAPKHLPYLKLKPVGSSITARLAHAC